MAIFALFLVFFLALFITGLIKPSLLAKFHINTRFARLHIGTRKKSSLVFGPLVILALIFVGVTAPNTPVKQPTATACFNEVSASTPRHGTDQPDDSSDYQVHIIYALPSDGVDKNLDTNGKIATSVSAWQNWLCNQTQGKYFRLDTYQRKLDVTFVKLHSTDNAFRSNPGLFSAIVSDLKTSGFNHQNKAYAIYYGGLGSAGCGQGANAFAVRYLKGEAPDQVGLHCDNIPYTNDFTKPAEGDILMIHEIIHALGFVPNCAAHSTKGHHVTDSIHDLLYQTGELTNAPRQAAYGTNTMLDYNHDDYYGANIANCPDLSSSAFLVRGGNELLPPW